jgi:hypothetical protein
MGYALPLLPEVVMMDVCKPHQWAGIGNVSVPPHRSLHGHRFFWAAQLTIHST